GRGPSARGRTPPGGCPGHVPDEPPGLLGPARPGHVGGRCRACGSAFLTCPPPARSKRAATTLAAAPQARGPARAGGGGYPRPPAGPRSGVLERRLLQPVLGNLGADAPPGQPADLGAAADVAPRLAQRLADVLLLDAGHRLLEQFRQRPVQVDVEG